LTVPVGTWEWDLATGVSSWSDGIYDLLGLAHGEGRAHVDDFIRFIHPDDRQRVVNDVESAIKKGDDYYGEFRVIRSDGALEWLSSMGRRVRDASGAERIIGVNINITERKRAEQAVRESEDRLRSAFDHATIGMALVASDGRFLQVNQSFCTLLGYSEQELLATNFQALTHPQDIDANLAYRRQLLAGETNAFQMEKRYLHKSGRTVWAMLNVALLRNSHDQPLFFISQIQDITERKRTELRFHIQNAVSRILSEATSLADAAPRLLQAICEPLECEVGEMWVPDRKGEHLTLFGCWSQAASELLEFASTSRRFKFYPGAGLPGRIWKSRQPAWIPSLANDNNFLRASLARTSGFTSGFGFPALVGDHIVAVVAIFSREARERDEDLLRVTLSLGEQIGQFIERQQADEALRISEDKFSKAFRSSPDAFIIGRQADGMILDVNERWTEMFGYARDEAVGRTVSELHIYKDDRDRTHLLSLVTAHGSARDVEIDCRKKSGEIRNVSISAEPIAVSDEPCLLLIVRDITERKRTEEALRRNEQALRESHARIEDLVGRLIVGQDEERNLLARELHDDVNQQLAALAIGLSDLKLRLSGADAGIQKQIAMLSKVTAWLCERIRKISHELHSTVLQHVGLAAALSSYCEEFSSREGIPIMFDIREGVDAGSPEAALCLYRVAQESLRNVAKHSRARSAVVELSQTRDAVELRVSDQGVGFDPGQLRQSRGLGLLSMEERVKLLHGSLEFAARPGAGTELKARIPLRTDDGQAKGPVG